MENRPVIQKPKVVGSNALHILSSVKTTIAERRPKIALLWMGMHYGCDNHLYMYSSTCKNDYHSHNAFPRQIVRHT